MYHNATKGGSEWVADLVESRSFRNARVFMTAVCGSETIMFTLNEEERNSDVMFIEIAAAACKIDNGWFSFERRRHDPTDHL